MNLKSEQLNIDNSVCIDLDQILSYDEKFQLLNNLLDNKIKIEKCNKNAKFFKYSSLNNTDIFLLIANITYLGGNGQHPIYKKRIQLKSWYKDVINTNKNTFILGIYKYNTNIMFVSFDTQTYINKKMNNSSAHVYINDLSQGLMFGIFEKYDKNNNKITVIRSDKINDYLNKRINNNPSLINQINLFNLSLKWNIQIKGIDAYKQMFCANFKNTFQAEWSGWYLEYLFEKFIKDNKIYNIVYTNSENINKKEFLDFDLYFKNDDFYGDLKSSDENNIQIIGNDIEHINDALIKHNKLWYLIYEHSSLKDKDSNTNYQTTRFWNNLKQHRNIKQIDDFISEQQDISSLSYINRMKHSIKFKKMYILEVNKINIKYVFNLFKQGKQPDGSLRKPKYSINKNAIDNFIIYSFDVERK
ncbi:hypothetical protein [Mycoplasma sp. 4423]